MTLNSNLGDYRDHRGMSVRATVNFVPLSQSGRKSQPFDHWEVRDGIRVPLTELGYMHFLPDARFEEDPRRDEYFVGLFIEWTEIAADGLSAKISLALRHEDKRLTRFLHPGSYFTLHEGRTIIATGEVIGNLEAIAPIIRVGDVVR